jgi:hypothetical protein
MNGMSSGMLLLSESIREHGLSDVFFVASSIKGHNGWNQYNL